ncbi:bis(5'-nucleosyl)-tetraphosphatase (symmetrical) YqeK [Treponema sp.]|uniref:bis(5'-nucleosyl)-tetraphosphatase (symmetrical) YqeK n=1 Tax=Treponema sp. TaxID=166 RepID=UPI00298ECC7E|nr:bis(5'-nucleosyl)-tetraphosphatase (symmetrical) YqeK [Treponema sp.]
MNNIDYEKKIEDIRKYTMAAVSESRYAHSVRTAQMCEKICEHYGMEGRRGYLCGIAHDMCKKMDDSLLIKLASKDGRPITAIEKDKPALLHGRAAAVKIKQDFGIEDPEVIEAIANHTFGGEKLCDLAKALYIADKIEPGREHVTREYLEKLFTLSLDGMAYAVLKESIDYLTKKGKKISPVTMDFYKELKKTVDTQN